MVSCQLSSDASVRRFLWYMHVDIDDARMIVHRRIPWVVISAFILLTCISSSTSVKLRKLRRRPTTTRTPYQQSRIAPVIIKVIHKYSDDEFAHGVPSNCTHNNCGNSREKFSSDIDETLSEQGNFLSDEKLFRYVVYPKKYEHFVSKKNIGHRYRRDASESSNASDRTMIDNNNNASGTLKNENKGKLKKITLQKIGKRMKIKDPAKPLSRTKRNLGSDYLARRNASDYYAQRRAVMERYYARQREINARYANRTASGITRLRYNSVPQHYPVRNNATQSIIEYGYHNKNSSSTTPRYPWIDLMSNRGTLSNKIPTELNKRRDIAPENYLNSNTDFFQSKSNIKKNALNYFTTTPCGPLSGTIAPKTRQKSKHCNEIEENKEESAPTNNSGNKRWGECKGKLVYQHNLLLGLTGSSNLDAIFEVIIEGSVCITCVETLRYNETRAKVTLESGGRGFEYAKLKLEGHENEGFSYIVKIWGVRKVGRDCGNVE